MEAVQFVAVASSIAAALFSVLIAVLGWLGNKIYTKLESLNDAMDAVKDELHERINKIDRRVTRVETIVDRRSPDHA